MSVLGRPLPVSGVGRAGGAVASFPDGDGSPLRSCVVTMEPIQAGTGDPAPDNIRPISGRTSVSVYSAPRVISFAPTQEGSGNPSPTNVRPILPGLTLERDDGTTLTVYGGELDTETGELTVTRVAVDGGDASWTKYITSISSFAQRQSDKPRYDTSTPRVIASIYKGVKSSPPASTAQPYVWVSSDGELRVKDTSYEDVSASAFRTAMAGVTFCYWLATPFTIQLSPAETSRAVEALGLQPVTVQLGRTVYGGTLDVATGELTITWVATDGGSIAWVKDSNEYRTFVSPGIDEMRQLNSAATVRADIYQSRCYNTAAADADNYVWARLYGGKTICVKDTSKSGMTAAQFRAAMTGVTFCYQLDTPQVVPLSPARVPTERGETAVWSPDGAAAAAYNKKSMLAMS